MKREKKILFFPFPLLSHTLRCLNIAGSLSGYSVTIASTPDLKSLILDKGFHFEECRCFNREKVLDSARHFNFNWINSGSVEEVFLAQVELIKKVKPDIIISDAWISTKMAAEFTSIPFISLQNAYLSRFYKSAKIIPGAFPLRRFLPNPLLVPFMAMGEKIVMKIVHKPFKKLRKKYQLKNITSLTSEFEGDKTLLCDLENIFPQHKLPDSYSWIGPLFHKENKSETEVISKLDRRKKTIVLTLGSSGGKASVSFLNTEEFSRYNVVVAGNVFSNPLNHVIQREFINLASILPECDLLVCHGGNGTVYLGLEAGVPVVTFPVFFEQEWCVQGFVGAGLVKTFPANSSSVKIKTCIEDILEEKVVIDNGVQSEIREWTEKQGEVLNVKINELISHAHK